MGLSARADCEQWPRTEGLLRAEIVLAGVLRADAARVRPLRVEGETGRAELGLLALERDEALLVDVALFDCCGHDGG